MICNKKKMKFELIITNTLINNNLINESKIEEKNVIKSLKYRRNWNTSILYEGSIDNIWTHVALYNGARLIYL